MTFLYLHFQNNQLFQLFQSGGAENVSTLAWKLATLRPVDRTYLNSLLHCYTIVTPVTFVTFVA